MMYEGYQFLYRKAIWRCRTFVDNQVTEPGWQCVSDTDEFRTFPVSEIAIMPQVVSAPQFRQQDATVAGHPGLPGSRGRYTRGCRCDLCRAANAAYMKRRRNRG